MYKLKTLKNDRQAEFYDSPCVDCISYYNNFLILGIYHDIDDKLIIQYDNNNLWSDDNKVNLCKVHYDSNGDNDYINVYGRKHYLKDFTILY